MIKYIFEFILKNHVCLPVFLNFASLNGCLLYAASNDNKNSALVLPKYLRKQVKDESSS